jgi:hypothetical protein
MMKSIFVVITLIGFSGFSFAQLEKVKIKKDKTARYYYEADSTCLPRDQTIKMITSFHHFYKALKEDKFDAFLACLSPATIATILPEKLGQKFVKLKGYAVNLVGKIRVKSIVNFSGESAEPGPIYICTMYLPEGQVIGHRAGFDALKPNRDPEASKWIGLHLTRVEEEFKVVILF